MRAGRFAALAVCVGVALANCGFLTACTNTIDEPSAEATSVNNMTGVSARDGGAEKRPVTPSFRAGKDAIAALIPAE